MKGRTGRYLLALAAVVVSASVALAGPIPPPPVFGAPTGTIGAAGPCLGAVAGSGCGESDLVSPFTADIRLNIDWMVLAPGSYNAGAWGAINGIDPTGMATTVGAACPSCYLYLFQGENTNPPGTVGGTPPVPAGNSMRQLTIGLPAGTVPIAGVLGPDAGGAHPANPADDLDLATIYHPAHVIGAPIPADSTPEPNFVNEEEGPCPPGDFAGDMDGVPTHGPGSGFCINPADQTTPDLAATSVAWNFDPLKPPHHETVTLFFASPLPPVYGGANFLDTPPPTGFSPWSTGVTNGGFTGDPVPVPGQIPEPATLLLFASGLVAIGAVRFWRRKQER